MTQQPQWLKPIATAVAIFIAAVLIAGILAVPIRSMRSPEGYDQPREHLNTKNTAGIPLYVLGDVDAPDGAKRIGGSDPAKLAVAFASYEDPENPLFGWGMNANTTTGYRAYTLASPENPSQALLSANLALRGKIAPLLWAGKETLPAATDSYLWSQRAAFWVTPSEGPFHHFWILGNEEQISFPAQSQADYAMEIGPYRGKGVGMSGVDMLSAAKGKPVFYN